MLSLLLVLSCCMLTVKAQRPSPQALRFSPLTSCLADSIYDRLDCISCDVMVTVDSAQGVDCRSMVEQHQSLDRQTCTELEDVLESIFQLDTAHEEFGCIEVNVRPKPSGEAYVVLADSPMRGMSTMQNIVLRGRGSGVSQSSQCSQCFCS